jgi:ribosome-associated protein
MTNEQPSEQVMIRLDQFLKISGLSGTGGQAKQLIQEGEVLVNGELETRRRRKLVTGDIVQFEGTDYPFDQSTLDE